MLYFLSGCPERWEIALTLVCEVESDLSECFQCGLAAEMRFLIKSAGLGKVSGEKVDLQGWGCRREGDKVCVGRGVGAYVYMCVQARARTAAVCEVEFLCCLFFVSNGFRMFSLFYFTLPPLIE